MPRSHPYMRRRSPRRAKSSGLYSSWNSHHQAHWGRRTWDALFLLAADFPHKQQCDDDAEYTRREVQEKRRAWNSILSSLPDLMSCPICGSHFKTYMRRHPVALQNREALMRWLYRAKDDVNCRTNRRSTPYKRVRSQYVPACGIRRRYSRG